MPWMGSYGLTIKAGESTPNEPYTPKYDYPIEELYEGKCNIYEYREVIHPNNFQSTQDLVKVQSDIPCRLSYNREQSTVISSGAAVVSQSITVFIQPDLKINPGSVLEITQHGVTDWFKGSGKPAVYCKHQEIVLEIYEANA